MIGVLSREGSQLFIIVTQPYCGNSLSHPFVFEEKNVKDGCISCPLACISISSHSLLFPWSPQICLVVEIGHGDIERLVPHTVCPEAVVRLRIYDLQDTADGVTECLCLGRIKNVFHCLGDRCPLRNGKGH